MAKNNLTPEQDILTRRFYVEVASNESLFPQDPVGRRNMLMVLTRLLGYVVVGGKFVSPEVAAKVKVSYGAIYGNFTDEWEADYEAARNAVEGESNEATTSSDSNKASSSESSKDSEVREAVLREDV